MNWKDRTVIRILLLVAALLADEKWVGDIRNLSNHINAGYLEKGQ